MNNYSDRKYTKLFVGGLAWETKSESLHRYFEQFGDIEEAVVIYDRRTSRSKGYGFVTFKDQESARRACAANPNPVIDGREANCNMASLGRRPHQPHSSPFGIMGPRTQGSPVISSPHGGSSPYQLPLTYGYHPGYYYPSYRPMIYGPGYLYPQMYATTSSKKLLHQRIAQPPAAAYGYASGGGYLFPSPNAMNSPGPNFGEAMQYSPGAFGPYLRPPPVLAMAPTGTHRVNKNSTSDQVAR